MNSRIQRNANLPELSSRAQLAIFCRALAREGYRDNIAGHVTYSQPDGTFLINPFELIWEEVRASDMLRIDRNGRVLEGKWSVTPAVSIHLEVHKVRPDVIVSVHNHPVWGTVWANAGRVPPVYDQTAAYIAADIPVFDEYEGGVNEQENARAAAAALGSAGCALLRNHGVLVVGQSIHQAHLRAVALETRCRVAWHVEALGGGTTIRADVAAKVTARIDQPDGSVVPHVFDSVARREIRLDPTVLD